MNQTITEYSYQERFVELEKIAKGYTTFAVKERPLIFRKALSENCFEGMSGEKLLVERFRPEMTDSLTTVLEDLIQNPDTSLWVPQDFKTNYVCKNRDEDVEIERYASTNWRNHDPDTFCRLKSRLKEWNEKDSFNRPISAISHPLMTTDGNYGLIE
ncbi:hypothetical protein [Jiulongibacter sediminis]|uniref:hypothetical protein n=1 Tax=Jiulongibacter sediminis TaxID=1605367 RepID=UPI0026E957CB|nr:hypothetical protein [Jiulongibacter sediminis]